MSGAYTVSLLLRKIEEHHYIQVYLKFEDGHEAADLVALTELQKAKVQRAIEDLVAMKGRQHERNKNLR